MDSFFPEEVQKSSYFLSTDFHKERTLWKTLAIDLKTDATNTCHSYLCLFLISLHTMLMQHNLYCITSFLEAELCQEISHNHM